MGAGRRLCRQRGGAERSHHLRPQARQGRATYEVRDLPGQPWNDRASSVRHRARLSRIGVGNAHQLAAGESVQPADRRGEVDGPQRPATLLVPVSRGDGPCRGSRVVWVDTLDRLKLDSLAAFVVFAAVCLVALFANKFININTFSLHGMYRMRLTRAYLGASNFARHPDDFTNFDSSDNMYETDMLCKGAPLHIINTALNLVATRNMAWQQRKAEPFTFSPISVGSWRLGYLPTEDYGGSKGVTLGTAMAISGAAFNPNMGYHSSPLVTLLMTFFNARLGWWLPNPIWPHLRKWPAGRKTSALSSLASSEGTAQSGL